MEVYILGLRHAWEIESNGDLIFYLSGIGLYALAWTIIAVAENHKEHKSFFKSVKFLGGIGWGFLTFIVMLILVAFARLMLAWLF